MFMDIHITYGKLQHASFTYKSDDAISDRQNWYFVLPDQLQLINELQQFTQQ